MAIYSNFTIDQGTSFKANIDITDTDGDALSLSGYTVAGQLRKSFASTTFTAFNSSVSNESNGTIEIVLSPTQTGELKSGRYVYDVEITKTSTGEITRVIEGQIEVTPGVTRT